MTPTPGGTGVFVLGADLTEQRLGLRKLADWGEVLIGFGILFIGLDFMKEAVPDLRSNPEVFAHAAAQVRHMLDTTHRLADEAGIGRPEVAIYDSPDLNAFATGAKKNDALVAVSTVQSSNGHRFPLAPLFDACRAARGEALPHFCYHPDLSVAGVCRLCQVEIEGMPKLTISCNTTVRDDMVVLIKGSIPAMYAAMATAALRLL